MNQEPESRTDNPIPDPIHTLRASLDESAPAPVDRASRYARFSRRTPPDHAPSLHAPVTAPSAAAPAPSPRTRLVRWAPLAVALLAILVLGGLLWQEHARTASLESQLAALQTERLDVETRANDLNNILKLQKEKLAGQSAQIETTDRSMEAVNRELNDLRDRMARLDAHNAELRDALGLTDASPTDETTTETATPGPQGFLPPAIGGAEGSLHLLAGPAGDAAPTATPADAADQIDSFRAAMAELNHMLGYYEQVEDDLTTQAAARMQQWLAAGDEDDSDTPDVAVTDTVPDAAADAPDKGAPPKSAPAKKPAAITVLSHIPSGYPYYGRITSPFGWRYSPFVKGRVGFHKGMDIAAPYGTAVRATQSGQIITAGWSNVYGRVVIIDHGDGWSTLYGHNSKLLVRVGDWVVRGQVIAYSGSTGQSTGPHIHYEIHHNGKLLNPANYR